MTAAGVRMGQGRQPFRVGAWNVDPTSGEIERAGQRVTLTPRAMDVLCFLAARPGVVVSANELLDGVWRGAEVAPGAVYQTILHLRRALDDDATAPSVIENVPRRGYRLVAEVLPGVVPAAAVAPAAAPVPETAPGRSPEPAPQPRDASAPPDRSSARRWFTAVALIGLLALALFATRGAWRDTGDGADGALRSIAVLPFRDSTPAGQVSFLADGVTEELVTTLGQLPGLTVTGRTSSLQVRNSTATPRELGELLGVRFLLEGRIRTDGERVRVDVALVSAHTGTQLWTESYDARRETLLAVQEDIARAVARSLDVFLSAASSERLARRARRDPRAYEVYLRGRYQWNRRNATSLLAARTLFEQAASMDPRDADAQVALAEVYAVMPLYGVAPPDSAFPLARAAAERALAIDAGRGEARATLAVVKYQYERDWTGAEREFRAAIAAAPNHATALQWYSEYLSYSRRFDEAERQIAAAHVIDPVSPTIAVLAGSPALWSHDYARAAQTYRDALRRIGDFPLAWYSLGLAQLGAGDARGALESLQRAAKDLGPTFVAAPLAHAHSRLGERERAAALLQELNAERATRYVSPYKLAVLHVALNDRAAALAALEEAERSRDDRLVLLGVDPLVDSLREEPRFRALAGRLGAPGS